MFTTVTPNAKVRKLQLEDTITFAIHHIPQSDQTTLEQFLELISAGGTFGSISHEQILKKMAFVLKYVPTASSHSLLMLLDLLEIRVSPQLALSASQSERVGLDQDQVMPFFMDVQAVPATS